MTFPHLRAWPLWISFSASRYKGGGENAECGCRIAVAIVAGNVGLAGVALPVLGAEPKLRMSVLVVHKVGVPAADVLGQAQAETSRIFAAIGVRLSWNDPPTSGCPLTVMIVRQANLGLTKGAADAMGAAPAADDRTGRLVYAYYDRIDASAQKYRTDVAAMLGHVMAHELGHILLARGSHSSAGLMSARWGRFEMDLVAASLLMFTNEQAGSIRDALRSPDGGCAPSAAAPQN